VRVCWIGKNLQRGGKVEVDWGKEEDCNHTFFHRLASGRRSRNTIVPLVKDEGKLIK